MTWPHDLVSRLLVDYVRNYLIDIVSVQFNCCSANVIMFVL